MTVVHITYGLTLGGIETMLVNISNEQVSAGEKVHIIVINDLFDESLVDQIDPRVTLHRICRRPKSKSPLPVIKLNALLRRIKPDVIHLHYASISRYIVGKSLKCKLCVTLHDMCTPANSGYLYKAGPVFAISNMVKEDIKRCVNLPSTAVFNGIKTGNILKKAGYERGAVFNIVQVSRLLHEKKGQDILLRAIARLKQQGFDNVRLTLIGDGPSRQYLQSLADELNISDMVEMCGSRSQTYIFKHLRDFDLFVQPSRFEGFGLTVAEAMAAKVPVLVSDNQAPMEVIDNGRYGYAFASEDADDCARQIAAIMTTPPDIDKIEAAAAHVDKHYSVENTANSYLRLYRQLIVDRNSK